MKNITRLLVCLICAAILATSVSAMSYTAYRMSELLSEETKRLKDQPEEKHYTVTYYKDAEHTETYDDLASVSPDGYVYYELVCDDGYYVKRIEINAEYMDGEKILFGSFAPAEPEINCVMAGDVNSDHSVTISDVTFLMYMLVVEYYDSADEMIVADYNGDGRFNILDCTELMKYIAKWDIELKGECAGEPEIYCRLADEKVQTCTTFDRGIMFYNTVVVDSTDELEAYIAKFSELYSMKKIDNVEMNSNFYEDDLRAAYTDEYFAENRLVIFDFSHDINGCQGQVYAENDGGTLRLAVEVERQNGVPSDTYAVFHHMLTVPRDSEIDLDAGISVYTRDYNMVGARYLQRYVDIAPDEMLVNNDELIEMIK